MNILICGSSGFVGRNIKNMLSKNGQHKIVNAQRKVINADDIQVDFKRDTHVSTWVPRLQNIDVIINAVGILRDNPNNPMYKLHQDTPIALFKACEQVGVKKIVHISALGIESGCEATYFTSRIKAEEALFHLPKSMSFLCLRPSVIYGNDGDSARMFRAMARLPIQCLPNKGKQQMQPVHINDICTSISNWINNSHAQSMTVDAVGLDVATMRSMLDSYREQLGHKPALHCNLPHFLTLISAKLGNHIQSSPLSTETLSMMKVPNTSDSKQFEHLLNHQPRSYKSFIS